MADKKAKKPEDKTPEKEPVGKTEPAPEEPKEQPEDKQEKAEPAPEAKVDYEALMAEQKDRYLRLAAEYDNFRKRSQKERESLYADVKCETIAKLLPVYDNVSRALRHQCTDESFYKGVEMIRTQMETILSGLGVTPIEAVGQPFDPAKHNAVMHVEDPEQGESVVVEEFEKGFVMGDKVVRFSVVKVAN